MKALCITMGPDWPQAKEQFNNVGIEVERFDAIIEDNRVLSFNKSVYACMKRAEGQDLLLFEDDVIFDNGDPFQNMFRAMMDLPDDFMTMHIGCNILGFDTTTWQMPTGHSGKLAKLHNCYQSHATFYSKDCVDFILDNFRYVTDEYKTEGCVIFDEWLRTNVLPMGRSYLMKPMIAYQRPRKSEIWNQHADYTYCHFEGNRWLKNNL